MHGFVCVYRCIVPDAAAVGASPSFLPLPFQHAAMRLQIEQKLPVSVAVVVVAALAVAAGKCEHFGQHSQVVAGELLAQKVLVMMILNYS